VDKPIGAIMQQKIIPCLWFDTQAEEAVKLYTSAFSNSTIGKKAAGQTEGSILTIEFEIGGHQFVALNGGPLFKFTPAVSFLVACSTREEVEAIWKILSEDGTALMELGQYPFSEKYGWTQDRYGLSWQVMFMGDLQVKQKITPTLMFVGEQSGKAEAAIGFYTSVFHNAKTGDILRYGRDEEPDKEGTLKHAAFNLENQEFAAMDSAQEHLFSFNEAISLTVMCETQSEIDYYWEKLIESGGQEGVCGWLKDKFGVSWQVVPAILAQMLQNPNREIVKRVTAAFLKMKKFNIGALYKAFEG
jgi:predicted 3-demethylubiquinone-9 3-methyltransferase (glyoxalase superfamily)